MDTKKRNRWKPLLHAAVGNPAWVCVPYTLRTWRTLQTLRARYGLRGKVALVKLSDNEPPEIMIRGKKRGE